MKFLSDVEATCAQKAADFEERQQLRGEEIEAIEKAIEIISSGAVAGNAEKHLPGLLQVKSTSFAQLRADSVPRGDWVARLTAMPPEELARRAAVAARSQTRP